jgi:hypothetical protein
MRQYRGVSRRSFLATVVGATAGTTLVTSSGHAAVQGCTDSDPSPSRGGDAAGQGRRCTSQPNRGCSDSDPSDAGGHGRSCTSQPRTGCSDRDPSDPSGRGRSCGGGGGNGAEPTGRRERRYEVCWVDHPSRSNEDCNIQTYSEWATTYSDGRVVYDTADSERRRAEMTARGYTARWHRMIVNEW